MSNRYSDPRLVPDKVAAMMNIADRRSMGILSPAERKGAVEHFAEAQLQRLCEQELSRRRIAYLHLSFRAREKKGWPDLTFVLPTEWGTGIPWAVELKSASGKVSDEQRAMLGAMRLNGWQVRVVRSFDDFHKILETYL